LVKGATPKASFGDGRIIPMVLADGSANPNGKNLSLFFPTLAFGVVEIPPWVTGVVKQPPDQMGVVSATPKGQPPPKLALGG
jgi:hypothetical protein